MSTCTVAVFENWALKGSAARDFNRTKRPEERRREKVQRGRGGGGGLEEE